MNNDFGMSRPTVRTMVRMGLLIFGAAQAGASLGQDAKFDLSQLTLDQLAHAEVYTASRHLQSIDDAPASVTLITARDIRDHGYRTLADVLRTVRGFYVTNDRNYSSIGVRGFARPGDFNTRILLLVDGHRLNDNLYDEAMIGMEFPVDVDLIDRIEIIRGPVSSLYGSNALFGVVNILVRKGRDLDGAEVVSSTGSFNSNRGRVSYGRRLGNVEFLVSGSFYGSKGHNHLFYPEYDDPSTNDGNADHVDDEQAESALASITYRDVSLRGVFGSRVKGIPTGAYGTVFNDSGTRTKDTHWYLDGQYQRTFLKAWDVMGRAFYDRFAYRGSYVYPSSSVPSDSHPELDFGDGRWAGVELQVTREVHRNRVQGGAEFRDNLRQNQTTFDVSPYVSQLDDRRKSYVAAFYLQDDVALTQRLHLDGGFRYDYYGTTQASIDPRVALIYRPLETVAIKVMYGEAFRAPNNYEMYYAVTPNVGNLNLKPEKIRTSEAVWEQKLPAHLFLSTAVFHSSMSGLITQIGQDDQSLIYRNLQQVGSDGTEVELRGQLVGGPDWVASYEFQETKDSDTHQFLSSSPRSLAKVTVSQRFPGTHLTASVDAQYRSRLETLSGGSVSPFAVVDATLLGRNIGRHLDVSAGAYNLLNKAYSDPASGALQQDSIRQDGRSLRLQVTWRLGDR